MWFAHYELGRLYEAKSEFAKAREQYELVMSGKMEGGKGKGKGKVSLQVRSPPPRFARSNADHLLPPEHGWCAYTSLPIFPF